MELDPLPPIHVRPPEPDPLPLRADVIDGWPLKTFLNYAHGRDKGKSEEES